jgi:hypothetical protein
MKRSHKISACVVGGVVLLGALLISYLLTHEDREVKTRELTSAELAGHLTHLNPKIRVLAGFEVSEYGGWHGDGGRIMIYLVAPAGMVDLVAGLRRFHEAKRKEWPNDYQYQWSESPRPDLNGLTRLIPARFLPPPDVYLIARNQHGQHTISLGQTNGFVCFTDSTF